MLKETVGTRHRWSQSNTGEANEGGTTNREKKTKAGEPNKYEDNSGRQKAAQTTVRTEEIQQIQQEQQKTAPSQA